MRIVARILSDLFNPIILLFPVPYLLVYRSTQDAAYSFRWAFFSWLFLLLIAVIIIYLVRRRVFTDMDVSRREQRPLLFLLSGILTFVYCFFVFLLDGPRVLMVTALGVMIGILLFSLINTRMKASIHVATVSAILFAVGLVYSGVYLFLFLLIPLVGWARVKMHRHSVSEAVVGSLLGSGLTLFMYILVKYILRIGN